MNAFAMKAATSAVIVGHSNKDLQIIYWQYFYRANIVIFGLALFHFSQVAVGDVASQVD